MHTSIALALVVLGVIVLIRAEKRGYSSTRVGLSVTAMFFAFVPLVFAMMKLIQEL